MQELWHNALDSRLIQEAIGIWSAGGWAMIALAINCLLLFGVGLHMWLTFRSRRFGAVNEKTWRGWITSNGDQRKGRIGELISFLLGAETLDDLEVRVNEIHTTELAPFRRDLKFMKRCVSTAPLLGLLGTVVGMLATFSGLASGSGGEKTMDLVAGGISEALITTETGLVIALPGLFFQYHLTRERDRYEALLAKIETACTQFVCAERAINDRAGGRPA